MPKKTNIIWTFSSRRETPAESVNSDDDIHVLILSSRMKWVIKFAMREWWSSILPPLHLLPSTHSFLFPQCGTDCHSPPTRVFLLLVVFLFHFLSPHRFYRCAAPSPHLSPSVSLFLPFLRQSVKHGEAVCSEDNSRGAQVREIQGTET